MKHDNWTVALKTRIKSLEERLDDLYASDDVSDEEIDDLEEEIATAKKELKQYEKTTKYRPQRGGTKRSALASHAALLTLIAVMAFVGH